MIITRTPFRLSLFGGGSDYPAWSLEHGGSVLSTTIDKYCYLTCRYFPPFFDFKYRAVYVKSESCRTIAEISHPVIREVLQFLKWSRGVEIHHIADLPARAGIGSSSSFTVGLLHALYGLKGQIVSKETLATESIHIEQDVLQETVGSQDQVTAAYGGLNHIRFLKGGGFEVRPLTLTPQRVAELESHLMLFYTGIRRTASDVADSYVNGIPERERQMTRIGELVDEGIGILDGDRDIREIGVLLDESWQVKKSLGRRISNSQVDAIYERACGAGAVGGKIAGAGGGGFMMLFVPPDRQVDVREALNTFLHVPFKFEPSGSQVVHYDRQSDYSHLEDDLERREIVALKEVEDAEAVDCSARRA